MIVVLKLNLKETVKLEEIPSSKALEGSHVFE